MKPNNILVYFMCFSFATLQAQDACEENILKAKVLLKNPSPFTEQADIFNLVESCALQGHAEAENYLGMLYLNGIGIEKDAEQAFLHMSNAASKGYDNAQYNLGRLYKYGTGCKLDFQKAMDWFETATANGNQRAAYSLGYMYYKGYGVPQDYTKAVYWFERSDDPMAKHFLGLCYYLGYGVAANEDKALEILLNNPIINSQTLVSYIEKEQKENIETKVAADLIGTTVASNPIAADVVTEIKHELKYMSDEALELKDIKGSWTGKVIQYDWSGKHIQRIMPVVINITVDDTTGAVQFVSTIEDQEYSSKAIWEDETLYLENLTETITLNELYPSHPIDQTLNYNLFSTSLQKYTHQGVNYIIGHLDSYIPKWTEYGAPMGLVLKPEGTQSNLDEEVLMALATQEDHFIKLYPVPFNDQITVQYQLETASNVYVELISLNGNNKIVIHPTISQHAGDHTYTIPVDNTLPVGLYVVRLIAGNQIYTRMIIKNN